jgi:hypothetical protein
MFDHRNRLRPAAALLGWPHHRRDPEKIPAALRVV